MNGYRVKYFRTNGKYAETWFSIPFATSGEPIEDDLGHMAVALRTLNRSGCVMLSVSHCTLEEFARDFPSLKGAYLPVEICAANTTGTP